MLFGVAKDREGGFLWAQNISKYDFENLLVKCACVCALGRFWLQFASFHDRDCIAPNDLQSVEDGRIYLQEPWHGG